MEIKNRIRSRTDLLSQRFFHRIQKDSRQTRKLLLKKIANRLKWTQEEEENDKNIMKTKQK